MTATLNTLLSEEADAICGAERYQRSPDRLDTRAGKYQRKLLTGVGELELQVSRLHSLPFETQIIERYKRKESSVEEGLVEMYLAGRLSYFEFSKLADGKATAIR